MPYLIDHSYGDLMPHRLVARKDDQVLDESIHVDLSPSRSAFHEERASVTEHRARPGAILDDSFHSLPGLFQVRRGRSKPLQACLPVRNDGSEGLVDFVSNRGG
jgi:hypothetical protein